MSQNVVFKGMSILIVNAQEVGVQVYSTLKGCAVTSCVNPATMHSEFHGTVFFYCCFKHWGVAER